MSDLLHIADKVRAGVKQLEWVKQLADALERVGSLEQAEAETKERLDIMREEVGGQFCRY